MASEDLVDRCCDRSSDERWMAIKLAQWLLETEPVDVVRGVLDTMGVSTLDWDFSYYEKGKNRFGDDED